MSKIKNIVFDFGGVIIELDFNRAVHGFQALGLKDAAQRLDPYTQHGIFGDMEIGRISGDDFRLELSKLVGRELSWQECRRAWMEFIKDLPEENLQALRRLRTEGYRLILLSNTNPYVMDWAMSPEFDGRGHSVRDYFDAIYLSYQCRMMKPSEDLFRLMLNKEQIRADETLFIDDGPKNTAAAARLGFHTFCPESARDWAPRIGSLIHSA